MPATNLKSVSFKTLSALSARQRVKLFNSPDGRIIFSLLTPTQFAELFPRYYMKQMPDISGFMKALPTSYTAAKQKMYEQQMERTVTGAKEGRQMGDLDPSTVTKTTRTYETLKKDRSKPSVGEEQAYAATKEEMDAYKKVQSGAIAADSAEAKIIGQLGADKLAALHVEKYTDPETHKEMYRYNPPEPTREQAQAALEKQKTGATGGDTKKNVYKAFIDEGFSPAQARAMTAEVGRENDFREEVMFGTHPEQGGRRGASHGRTNIGIISFADSRRRDFIEFMQKNGGMDEQGNLIRNQNTLRLQARFIREEMPKTKAGRQFLDNKDISESDSEQVLSKYIGWDIQGKSPYFTPEDAARARAKRARYYNSDMGETTTKVEGKGPGGAYTKEQIDEQLEKIKQAQPGEHQKEAAKVFAEMHKANANKPGAPQVPPPPVDRQGNFDYKTFYEEVGTYRTSGHGSKKEPLNIARFGEEQRFGHLCGIGVSNAVGVLFGDARLKKAEKMHAHKFSATGNSTYFQELGYYQNKKSISDSEFESIKKNPKNLIPGTIIATGSPGGQYHINVWDGHKWISDTVQRHLGAVEAGLRPSERGTAAIHIPGPEAISRLHKDLRSGITDEMLRANGIDPKSVPPAPPITEDQNRESYQKGSSNETPPSPEQIATQSVTTSEAPTFQPQQQQTTVGGLDVTDAEGKPIPGTVERRDASAQAAPTQTSQQPPPAQDPISQAIDSIGTASYTPKEGETSKISTSSYTPQEKKDTLPTDPSQSAPEGYYWDLGKKGDKPKLISRETGKEVVRDTPLDTKKLEYFVKVRTPDLEAYGKLSQAEKDYINQEKQKRDAAAPTLQPTQTETKVTPADVGTKPVVETKPVSPTGPSYAPGTPAAKAWENRPKFGEPTPSAAPTATPVKKEEPKAPATPTASATPAPAPTTPEPPKKEEPKKQEAPAPAHAGGGREKVDGPLTFSDMSPQRGDNTLVSDTSGKQFSMNKDREVLQVNPNTNVVDIKPTTSATIQAQSKVQSDMSPAPPTPPAPTMMASTATQDEQKGIQMTGSMGKRSRSTNDLQPSRDTNLIPTLMDQSRQMLKNPSAMRAFARAGFGETGDVLDGNKHTYGNNSRA